MDDKKLDDKKLDDTVSSSTGLQNFNPYDRAVLGFSAAQDFRRALAGAAKCESRR